MSSSESLIIQSIALRSCCRGIFLINYSSPRKSRMRWRPKPAVNKPSSKSAAAADGNFEHIQAFFDTARGQITIGEIPPIRRAALAAVGKKARVALVCGETESVADLLHRLNAALGRAAAENIVIDEVLPEIKRRR